VLASAINKFARWSRSFQGDSERWGFYGAVHILLMQALSKYLRLHVAWINTREINPAGDLPNLPEGYSVRQLSSADYESAIQDPELDMSPDFVSDALGKGDFCVGAFFNDVLVSYIWRALSTTAINDCFSLVVEKPNRYGYKALTLPDHRGKHLPNAIGLFSDKLCFDLGYTRAISFIETHNYASIRSDARRGNRHAGWIAYATLGPIMSCYTSKGARELGVAVVRREKHG
jgi:hypothetical protein